jgi:hypothetical protein
LADEGDTRQSVGSQGESVQLLDAHDAKQDPYPFQCRQNNPGAGRKRKPCKPSNRQIRREAKDGRGREMEWDERKGDGMGYMTG